MWAWAHQVVRLLPFSTSTKALSDSRLYQGPSRSPEPRLQTANIEAHTTISNRIPSRDGHRCWRSVEGSLPSPVGPFVHHTPPSSCQIAWRRCPVEQDRGLGKEGSTEEGLRRVPHTQSGNGRHCPRIAAYIYTYDDYNRCAGPDLLPPYFSEGATTTPASSRSSVSTSTSATRPRRPLPAPFIPFFYPGCPPPPRRLPCHFWGSA